MFTWICPQCGREVPPSYNDCPDCAAKGKAEPPPAQPSAPLPGQPPAPAPPQQYQQAPPQYPPPQYQQPPQYQPPPQYQQPIQYQPPPQYAEPAPGRSTLPTWLMSVLFALAFGGVVAGAYYAVEYMKKEPSQPAQSGATIVLASASRF